MLSRKSYFLVPAACAGLLLVFVRPARVEPQAAPPSADIAQFRIAVGLTDTAAKPWAGTLGVTGGALDGARGWRFSQQDRVDAQGGFSFRTKTGMFENQLLGENFGQTGWGDKFAQRIIPEGLIVRVKGPGRVQFSSDSGNFEFSAESVALGKPLEVLGGNGSVERLPIEERISETGPADDAPAIAVTADGARWIAYLSYQNAADRVLVSGGGKLHEIAGKGDHQSPTIADDGKGRIWVVWSQNDQPVFHLYARSFDGTRWSAAQKLTGSGGNNIWPRLVANGAGRLALVWQGFRNNQAVILVREYAGGAWSAERQVSEGPGNCWAPSAAYDGAKLWIAWDSYATGAYQIYVRQGSSPVQRITRGEDFSVRPSIAVVRGTPVVAWEESDALWGKDYTFLFDRRGTFLYKNRRIRVAYLEAGEWKELAAPVTAAVPASMRRFVQQPLLATDDAGHLYMSFRVRTSTATSRYDGWANNGRWNTFVTHLDGSRWTGGVEMPSSDGRNSMIAPVAMRNGKAYVAWPTDNRIWPGSKYGEIDVYVTTLETEGSPARLEGGHAIAPSVAKEANAHPNEAADTKQIRAYRIGMNGKNYRILRGDLHRHTELSNDGAGDGMLDDLYRYTLDAAAMDYAHVGDHQMGNDDEYSWWMTQKSNDLYYMPERFVPLYGYERSVWWPNGHRNIVWAERGKPVLAIGQPEAKGNANSGPILYPYLRQTNGIATSHSSATEQGTDWRDNDPALEPIVEIYQGFESNYEHAGAPRSWKQGEAQVHQGERPAGYVWNAWAKGYKLGVQASSDHVSTHSSYACIVVEDFTRQGLVDAMRKRHTYAATDSIVMDMRAVVTEGTYLMGDIFETKSQPKIVVKVMGTAPIKQIDVIKNNTYVYKVNPNSKTATFEYVDSSISAGESYYYVRAEQTDGQLAWASPVWVKYSK